MSSTSFVMPNDLTDLCRVCLQLPEESQYLDLTTIYDEEDNLTYGECFTICTQIDLSAGEDVPHNLCKSCGLELQMSYDFYKKVEESKRVIEQCQKQLEEQKESAIDVLPTTVQQDKVTCDIEQQHDNDVSLIEKYVGSDCDEDVINKQDDSVLRDQTDFITFSENQQSNEINIMNNQEKINEMCETTELKETFESIEPSQESNIVADIEEHLDLEDYQNLEALEEEGLKTFGEYDFIEDNNSTNIDKEQKIKIENISITACIQPGIRLPLPKGPPFVCEFCGHNAPTKALLASHRHRKHRLKVAGYECTKCDKQFNSKDLYDKHINRLSCQRYPEFTCDYCLKKIIGSANYKIHLRFHQKIYPFKCDLCSKGFMMAVHLKTHVQTKHENKRFICEEANCGKFFQSQQSLKSHIYTHLGSMPYCCQYCDKKFPNRGRLRWHLTHSHNLAVSVHDLDHMLIADEISIKAEVKPVILNNH